MPAGASRHSRCCDALAGARNWPDSANGAGNAEPRRAEAPDGALRIARAGPESRDADGTDPWQCALVVAVSAARNG